MEQPNMNMGAPQKSSNLKTLTIVGIIANILWLLIMLISLSLGPDGLADASGLPQKIANIVLVIVGIGIVLLALKLWGLIKMNKMQKGGYVLYLIPNILISFVLLLGYIQTPGAIGANGASMIVFASWIGSIIFMVMLGKEMQKLNQQPPMM